MKEASLLKPLQLCTVCGKYMPLLWKCCSHKKAGDGVYFGGWEKSLWLHESEAPLKSCGWHSNTKILCPMHV